MQQSSSPGQELVVVLARSDRHTVLGEEPVSDRDLADLHDELWYRVALRGGQPEVGRDEVRFRTHPVRDDAGQVRRDRFEVEAVLPDGSSGRQHFGLSAVREVAVRAGSRLLAEGRFERDDTFSYHVRVGAPAEVASGAGTRIEFEERSAPLVHVSHPLAPLLARAEWCGPRPAADQPAVFFTRSARERAELLSRKGAAATPPMETGCVLVGLLCSCPDSGELYVLVSDAIEALDTEATTFSLTYSSATLARIDALMKARRADPRTRNQRILGQAHGHNFRPSTSSLHCEECSAQAECDKDTAFLSESDMLWARAFFRGEPWAVHLIFGMDSRGSDVEALFGLRRGAFERRGFHLISDSLAAAVSESAAAAFTSRNRSRNRTTHRNEGESS